MLNFSITTANKYNKEYIPFRAVPKSGSRIFMQQVSRFNGKPRLSNKEIKKIMASGTDEEVWQAICQYIPLMRKLARKLPTGGHIAEDDHIMDTIVRIFKKRKEYNPKYEFGTFVGNNVRNCRAVNTRKINQNSAAQINLKLGEALMGDHIYDTKAPLDELIETERLNKKEKTIKKAMKVLDKKEKRVLQERYKEEKTYQKIADSVGISIGDVFNTERRAIKKIKEQCNVAE